MSLNNLSTGRRLWLAFILVLLITALISVVSLLRMGQLRDALDYGAEVVTPRVQAANQWADEIHTEVLLAEAFIHTNDPNYERNVVAEINGAKERAAQAVRALSGINDDPAVRQALDKAEARRAEFLPFLNNMLAARASGRDLPEEQEKRLQALGGSYTEAVGEVQRVITSSAATGRSELVGLLTQSKWLIVAGALLALGIGTAAAVVVTRSITGPAHKAAMVAQAVSTGDLTREVQATGRDEMAQLLGSLSQMRLRLVEVVGEVRRNADGLAVTSREIAAGSGDLASRTEQQASALQQTAASMEELNTTVSQNAEHARRLHDLAQQATGVAQSAGALVARVVETMHTIDDSSKRISDIIAVIDGIAFQTNILALNAAVEAARAGEQGRGFAVVAAEVRQLAQRSSQAAKEIKDLITASVQRVRQGSALVDQAGQTMEQVVSAIQGVSQITHEITTASKEQSVGVAQVSEAVTQMDQTTQQNAAMVEQLSAAAAGLQDQAEQLVRSVSTFRLSANDSAAAAHAMPAPDMLAARAHVAQAQPAMVSHSHSHAHMAGAGAAPRTPRLAPAGGGALQEGWESF